MLIAKNFIRDILTRDGNNPGFDPSPEKLDDGFVSVGFETEGYEHIPETTGPLVIGRVESITELEGFKKPIRHCQVNVGNANGTGELQSIVCGARNFTEGDLVVVSLPGCVLPGDFKIAARKAYGKLSAGMICSAAELGLTDKQTKGIIVLAGDAGQPGDDARQVLGLDDVIFDVNVTPDRGYALSARGLGREIASAFDATFVDPASHPEVVGLDGTEPAFAGELVRVSLREETEASRFGVISVKGAHAGAESPMWLQRQLMTFGQRPVNAATDVTNYVMMTLGQPMHAFDGDKLTGDLVIRNADQGARLVTLDGQTLTLAEQDVVVCDEAGIQSLAGVMGGAATAIGDETTTVYFEAATWNALRVARTSRRHKLSSEASRRFERGVDPRLIEKALVTAANLLVSIAGGAVVAQRTIVGNVPTMPTINFNESRAQKIAGKPISRDAVIARLKEVGCVVAGNGEVLSVTPPTWRPDLNMQADLVEEVLRLEGLGDIPSIQPVAPAGQGLTPAQKRRRAVGHALAYGGYIEIIPTPFVANDFADLFGLDDNDARRRCVKVINPLESDYACIGTMLLPSMLGAVRRNVTRGEADLSLYGVAQVAFAHPEGRVSPMLAVDHRPAVEEVDDLLESLPRQPLHVATVGCGQLGITTPLCEGYDYSWSDSIESARIVARAAGVELAVRAAAVAPWHPGRCAELVVDGTVVGHAGELHPQVVEKMHLPVRCCAMEMDLSALPLREPKPAPMLSAFPALLQDLALVVDADTPAEDVRLTIVQAGTDLLESVELYDVYVSDHIGEGKKSLTFALKYRAADRTLTEDEANALRDGIVKAVGKAHGATMRA